MIRHKLFVAIAVFLALVIAWGAWLWRAHSAPVEIDETARTQDLTAVYIARANCQDIDETVEALLNKHRTIRQVDVDRMRRGIDDCLRAAIAKDIYRDRLAHPRPSASPTTKPWAAQKVEPEN